MTLKWWGPTRYRTHSACLFWLQSKRITPMRHNVFKKHSQSNIFVIFNYFYKYCNCFKPVWRKNYSKSASFNYFRRVNNPTIIRECLIHIFNKQWPNPNTNRQPPADINKMKDDKVHARQLWNKHICCNIFPDKWLQRLDINSMQHYSK